ncbi:MAG: hypothetical protein BWX55_01021 [Deltaproteobacteria bacterium ADurb.Bin022]|jgi:hypothetical protein|nr:MAG: hypothetical protein BWX55_01021 [Deltaproteobacteria bacterium ADurb.Bin022]
MNNAILWIIIIIFSVTFLWWIYKDGKLNDLMAKKIKDFRAAEIFTILYLILLIFSLIISLFRLIN